MLVLSWFLHIVHFWPLFFLLFISLWIKNLFFLKNLLFTEWALSHWLQKNINMSLTASVYTNEGTTPDWLRHSVCVYLYCFICLTDFLIYFDAWLILNFFFYLLTMINHNRVCRLSLIASYFQWCSCHHAIDIANWQLMGSYR